MSIKCDLVLLTWNNLKILKQCVDSILRFTHTPSCLIIVDNGSTEEGMKEYLSSLNGNGIVKIQIITNSTNEGYAKGMNKGMKSSSSPYVCLLNNDILVTDGWLEEMIKVADSNPEVGIVNPSSNNFGLRFGKDTTLEEFATTFKSQTGKFVRMSGCVGFCMLIKRQVIEKVGYLDENYGLAYFEDTDFSRRAQDAGFKCVMAKGCYVYHLEGRSVNLLSDKDILFKKNAQRFYEKWGRAQRIAYIISRPNEAYFRKSKERIETEVQENNRIWIFQKDGSGEFEAIEHLDIMLNRLPSRFFKLNAFWNIVKKKKKFDKLYVDDDKLRNMLRYFNWLHKAEIMPDLNDGR